MSGDPEKELRAIWTARGIPVDRQDQIIADIEATARRAIVFAPVCRHRDDGRGRCIDCGEFI